MAATHRWNQMHKLLRRQIEKATKPSGEIDFSLLANFVSRTYESHARARRRVDRRMQAMLDELDRVNARMVEAFDALPEGLAMIGPDGRFVLTNKKYVEFYGMDPRQVQTGKRYEDALRSGILAGVVPAAIGCEEEWIAARLARQRQAQNLEEQCTSAGRWLRVEERRMSDGGTIGVRIDITELKRKEESFRLLFDGNPVPMFVVDTETRTISAVNDAAISVYGYTRKQFIEMSLADLLPPAEVGSAYARLETERILSDNGISCRHIAADGREMKVDIYSRPIVYNGRPSRVASVFDVTERELAREAERSYAAVLSATFDGIADPVLVLDDKGKIILSNTSAQRFFAVERNTEYSEWSKNFERFHIDGVTPYPLDQLPIVRMLRGEPIEEVELVVRRKDMDTALTLLINGQALRDENGNLKGGVFVYRDTTEARESERRYLHAQKLEAIGQLTGGIAHDFNNILTVITGMTEILAERLGDRSDLHGIATTIDAAAERASSLTHQLLAFARKQPLQPRAVQVNELVDQTALLLRSTLGEKFAVDLRLESDAWDVLADPGQLTSALVNLAVNSRDAMPEGGRITIQTGNVVLEESVAKSQFDVEAGPYVTVSVCDTGTGIPESVRERLFEPFFTTKEAGKGTGLGLPMVYGFVKQSGGHIMIDSEVGKGTTITLYLPQASTEPVSEWITLEEPHEATELKRESILVVEDDQMVREFVSARLQSLGFETLTATNAEEALAILDGEQEIDLMFTDLVMPGIDGWELAKAAAKKRPMLNVLFTSGYNEQMTEVNRALDDGMYVLRKPYRRADLAKAIRNAIDGRIGPPNYADASLVPRMTLRLLKEEAIS